MSIFDYKAKNFQGETISGAIDAPSEDMAASVLKEQNLIIISLLERRKPIFFQSSLGLINRVKLKDVVVFARQLSVMVSANVPLVSALRVLTKQTENVTFKIMLSEIADEVNGGAKLSYALSRYPQVFSDFFIHMIRSGETTGKLDEILNYLADQAERDYDLHSKIRGAMIYPAFILTGLFVVGALMMVFVIPKLTSILLESGAKLPLSTRMLITTSNFFKNDWWLILVVLVGAATFYNLYRRTEIGKRHFDLLKLKLPVFGSLYQRIYLNRFSRSLSTLLVSGVPLTRSLEIVADLIGNTVYKGLVQETIREVEIGNPVATVFKKSEEIPPMLSHMLTIGEQTGKLDFILKKIADFYAREIENAIANLVNLIEPIVMVLMGVAVGILVTAIILPMYNLSAAL